jgi:hypothetical protein
VVKSEELCLTWSVGWGKGGGPVARCGGGNGGLVGVSHEDCTGAESGGEG